MEVEDLPAEPSASKSKIVIKLNYAVSIENDYKLRKYSLGIRQEAGAPPVDTTENTLGKTNHCLIKISLML